MKMQASVDRLIETSRFASLVCRTSKDTQCRRVAFAKLQVIVWAKLSRASSLSNFRRVLAPQQCLLVVSGAIWSRACFAFCCLRRLSFEFCCGFAWRGFVAD